MEPQLTFQDSIVLPTGATTGERIEINVNDNGLINIYNASNQLVATIGGADGSVYVTDGSTNFVKLVNGQAQFGGYASGSPDFTNAAVIDYLASFPYFQIFSHLVPTSSLNDAAEILMFPGAAGLAPPQIFMRDKAGTAPVQGGIFGALTYSDSSNNIATWQSPVGAAGYSVNGTLFYRRTNEDEVKWTGRFVYTGANVTNSGGVGNILNAALATQYRPVNALTVPLVHLTSTNVLKNVAAMLHFNTDGTVAFQWGDGMSGTTHDATALATNDIFWVSTEVPLNNIA